METGNEWCANRGRGGLGNWGDKISVNGEDGKKMLTKRAVTTEAGSLFQHFTTLTENPDPLVNIKKIGSTSRDP